MRIIGGRDYYDGVVGYDSDRTINFVRTRYDQYKDRTFGEAFVKKLPFKYPRLRISKSKNPEFLATMTIFCGKIYFGIKYCPIWTIGKEVYFWDIDSFMKFKTENPKININFSNYWNPGEFDLTQNTFEKYFEPVSTSRWPVFDKYLIENQFVNIIQKGYRLNEYDGSGTQYVPNSDGLKAINFQKKIEPWMAYQEIEMYLGTCLVNDQDHMVSVSDRSKLRKHGFDAYSFKNKVHPSKPRGHKDENLYN